MLRKENTVHTLTDYLNNRELSKQDVLPKNAVYHTKN